MPSPTGSGDQWSDSEFDENSDFQSSQGLGSEFKATPSKGDRGQLKNLPFDEALDVSGSSVAKSEYGNGLDTSLGSLSDAKDTPQKGGYRGGGGGAKDTGGGRYGGAKPTGKSGGVVKDKPFDEAHSLGDESDDLSSDESVMTNESEPKRPYKGAAQMKQAPPAKTAAQAAADTRRDLAAAQARSESKPINKASGMMHGNGDESSSSGDTLDSDEDDDDDSHHGRGAHGAAGFNAKNSGPGASSSSAGGGGDKPSGGSGVAAKMTGAYNMNDYKHLSVSTEIKDLFQYIQRYKPHEVELDTTLKCFIPDFIPAVGEMDAFIKVPQPDGIPDNLGLKVLDEPAALQSDATVLELQLRAGSKKPHGDLSIRSIENANKNPLEIDKWIKSIQDLHKMKPSVEVQYKRNMPDVDSLMQEWPPGFEEILKQVSLPDPEINLSTEEYAKVLCAMVDVPVYENIIESLHLVFSLYTAFKENPHFAARLKENDNNNNGGGGGGGGGGYNGGGGGNTEDFGGAQVFTLDGTD